MKSVDRFSLEVSNGYQPPLVFASDYDLCHPAAAPQDFEQKL